MPTDTQCAVCDGTPNEGGCEYCPAIGLSDIDALADTALDSGEMLHMLAQESSHPIAEVDGAYTDLLAALNSLVATAKDAMSTRRKMSSNAANLEFAIIERNAARSALSDAQMKERAMTDYFADASRRADELEAFAAEVKGERNIATARAERAERELQAVDDNLGSWESPPGDFQCIGRVQTILNLKAARMERDELIRHGLTDLTNTARQLEKAERERDAAEARVAALTVAVEAWEPTLSSYWDGPEREAVRAALLSARVVASELTGLSPFEEGDAA